MKSIKSMIAVLLIALVTVTLSGCGKSIPQGNDSEVKALAMEIIQGHYKNMVPAKELKKATITNVRDMKIDEALKKSRCTATLTIYGSGDNIEYTAQYNADGILYVEVFGLRQ